VAATTTAADLVQRGGGHKRTYRMVDFKRRARASATVERIEYDPNRTAFIALIKYENGDLSYILAPQRLNEGDTVVSGSTGVDVKPGNCMPLSSMPVGTIIHNVEMKPGKGGQIARSAGAYAQLVGRDQGMAILRLKSGEQRLVASDAGPPLARCRTRTT
jgi:large subunit ribosomal protein L2